MTTKQKLFPNIDFDLIAQDPNFKEDSVREIIILPIIKNLGYQDDNIVRSKMLNHPFLKVGSNKKTAVKLISGNEIFLNKKMIYNLCISKKYIPLQN